VAKKHHVWVRWSHWLIGRSFWAFILSGISIYWACPSININRSEYGSVDVAADIGIGCAVRARDCITTAAHRLGLQPLSLGPGVLAVALRLHWFCAYYYAEWQFTLQTIHGRGCAPYCLPDRSVDALRMLRYYVGVPFAKLMRRKWLHPVFNTKSTRAPTRKHTSCSGRRCLFGRYGVAIHKPCSSIAGCNFGGYNAARVWHFWLCGLHPLRCAACDSGFGDGRDTLRQHDRRLSTRVKRSEFTPNENKARSIAWTTNREPRNGSIRYRRSVSAEKRQGLFGRATSSVIEMAPESALSDPGATFCCLGLVR